MKIHNILTLSLIACTFFSCEKDPVIPNEEELITHFTVALTPDDGQADVILAYSDEDGEGGQPATIAGGTIRAGITYQAQIAIANRAENPPVDIGAEVQEEGTDHQFFFASTFNGLQLGYLDADANGRPIGLWFSMIATETGEGIFRIILRHEPAKDAPGVSMGDITQAGGETDIEIDFPLVVE